MSRTTILNTLDALTLLAGVTFALSFIAALIGLVLASPSLFDGALAGLLISRLGLTAAAAADEITAA